jgi:hypothetical protein
MEQTGSLFCLGISASFADIASSKEFYHHTPFLTMEKSKEHSWNMLESSEMVWYDMPAVEKLRRFDL